jgi:pSer/pThr/pTyr-binding forkhead associated (FHA) protein
VVKVQGGEALARAACLLASLWQDGDLAGGHLEVAPLLPPQPVDSGPARLHFRGQDFILPADSFILGHHLGCDLVLDSDRYPAVSSRHCEILYDRRAYLLRDRSHYGTWVNDHPVKQQVSLRPGDWICLGPATDGPALRFLGQPASGQRRLTTSA